MKENKVFIARGGVSYIAPECELIELESNVTICTGSQGTMGIDPWGDPFDTGLDF